MPLLGNRLVSRVLVLLFGKLHHSLWQSLTYFPLTFMATILSELTSINNLLFCAWFSLYFADVDSIIQYSQIFLKCR